MPDQDTAATPTEVPGDEFVPASDPPALGAAGDETNGGGAPDDQQGDGAGNDDAPELELLDADTYAAVKDDPEALRKALLKSYTQKMQDIGKLRDLGHALSDEKLAPQVIAAMARAAGLEVRQAPKATDTEAETYKQEVMNTLEEAFGKEAADKLFPLFSRMAEHTAKKMVEPINAHIQKLHEAAAAREAEATWRGFVAKYPDAAKLEKDMEALSHKILPAEGMSDDDYTLMLYQLAKAQKGEAPAVAATVARIKESARHARTNTSGVPGNRVVPAPAKKLSFDEAFALARQGKRVER